MAEGVVSFLLQKLDSLLTEEVRNLSGIRNEITDVRDELQSMKAFLRDADALENQDELLKDWVKQIRELSYDTEDLIDEFLLRFEHPRHCGLCGRLSKIVRVIKTLKARHRVASELRRIKASAISISERRQRFSLEGRRPGSGASRNDAQSVLQQRKDVRLVPEARLVGIEEPKKKLITWLLEDAAENRAVKVLAVQGMGGLGKTTLVNQVYKDDELLQQFQHRAWITVSQSFEEHEVLKEIIKQLYKGIGQPIPLETDSMGIYSLKEDIQSFLSDKKFLIVLDDIWNSASWESLKHAFPDNNFGSRIMVTTRNLTVANFVTRDLFKGFVYLLEPLSSGESWNLFCGRVFQGQPCPPHLEEPSGHIIKRCMGLPLAIVSISGVLVSKDTSIEEWERVRCSLEADLYGNNQLSDMEKILSLSFNDLPYHLKSCLMYLSMFPEDYKFNKDYWIKLWIAEGFVQGMGNKTPEEVGEFYVSELLSRNLIQENTEDKYKWFRVHELVREILFRKCSEQNFIATTNERFPIVRERVRRLSIGTTLEQLRVDHTLSKLRSLIFLRSKGFVASSVSMSEFLTHYGVRLLKVLQCSYLPLDTFPKFITTQHNLKFLNLSHTKLTSIPHSIGRLRKLETLNLRDTLVEELPAEILQISGLRHLTAYREVTEGSPPNTTYIGVRVPTGMGTLTSLQTLETMQVNQCGGLELITSLGKLKQLRELRIQELREEHGSILCSSIEQMSHLRKLEMEPREEGEILDVQHISSPPVYLKELGMSGRLMQLPSWVGKLQSLTVLMLNWSKLIVDPLESLQALPNLEILCFSYGAYDGEELCFRAGGFQMLKDLSFVSLSRLRRVTVEEGAMPRLQFLEFRECKLLEEVPSGIEFLSNLNKLELLEMGDQFITRLCSESGDSDLQRIKHVPSLFMGEWNNAERKLKSYLSKETS